MVLYALVVVPLLLIRGRAMLEWIEVMAIRLRYIASGAPAGRAAPVG
jgi:hypothetical protein